MKIVIYSSTFLPNIGGLENIMSGLASTWVSKGNSVTVFTKTPLSLNGEEALEYKVSRNPSLRSILKAAKQADIFIEANISLKTCLVGILVFKKWVVIHHLPYNHEKSIPAVLKNMLTWVSKNIAVSKYISNTLYGKSTVIHNFYNPIYKNRSLTRSKYSLLFVGRLVSDKGVLLLLNAIIPLLKLYPTLQLSIAGDGNEKNNLVDFVKSYRLENAVSFCGSKAPENLSLLYNQHEIVVIPSIWEEPFGIVALEALACDAQVVYAAGGGLSEAVSDNCISFKRGSVRSLEEALIKAIQQSHNISFIKNNSAHLKSYSIDYIASSYLAYFQKIIQ